MIAWEPSWTALRLERELLSREFAGAPHLSAEKTYPRNMPVGVRTAETMYTGGRDDMMGILDVLEDGLKAEGENRTRRPTTAERDLF